MRDVVERFQRAQALFGDRVDAVPPASWDEPTALPGWSVRALVRHLVDEQRWVAPLLAGQTPAEVGDRFSEDPLGDDPGALGRPPLITRSLRLLSRTRCSAASLCRTGRRRRPITARR